MDRFTAARHAEGTDPSTIAKEHTTLRAALKIALRRKEWTGDVSAIMPIGYSPEYKPRRRVLRSGDDLQALVDELPEDRGAHVCYFVATAARDSEAARAEVNDIDLDRYVVDVRGTKTMASDDTIAAVAWMRPLLEHVLRVRGQVTGPMFRPWGNIRRDLGEACMRVGAARVAAEHGIEAGDVSEDDARAAFPPLSPNDLRRTHATWLRAAGVGLVSRQLRHVDTRMVSKVYGHLDAVTAGRSMAAALGCDACDAGVTDGGTRGGKNGRSGRPTNEKPRKLRCFLVPRDGIEPPTRGFSIPCSTN